MRAVLCHACGAAEGLQLGDAPPPIPADGEVVIAVRAVGINYADAIMVAGRYQTKPALPFSPGLEAAGIVAACGDRVTRFRPGDRVMAILAHGGLAELAAALEAETFAIPDRMSFEEAGAFPVAYISSHVALRWQARLELWHRLGRPASEYGDYVRGRGPEAWPTPPPEGARVGYALVPSWCQTWPVYRVPSARALTREVRHFARLASLDPPELVPERDS